MDSQSPEHILNTVFGFQSFRPGQHDIITGITQGQDQFVLMPTGGGKSLCYQIPALIRSGMAIVVSPLISLMQDQVQALQANGVNAAYYNSSLAAAQARSVLARLHQQQLDLLYVAPERLMTPSFMERLADLDIALFAIDEAHCISQWGHEFRPEYVQLGNLRQHYPDVPMIALTATADIQTRQDIIKQLHLHKAQHHIASFDRPNIRYTVLEKHQPKQQLIRFLKQHPNEAGIVYCTTRKRVEEVSQNLSLSGYSAKAYHAGLSTQQRSLAQDEFQRDDIQIVVATIAFGMGIDKPNVRFIVHYDLSKNIESYYQETGRAGRDNLPAEVLLLYNLSDVVRIKALLQQTMNPTQRRIELHKLNAITGFAEAQTCRRRVLLTYFSETMNTDCGNCDVCLNPPETYDATVDAQKALSCIYRVKQRFGLMHIIDVLRGKATARMTQYRHDQLSTFGIGKHHSERAWQSIFRQLIHRGFVEQDIAQYSILRLTQQAKPLLRGELSLELAKPRFALDAPSKQSKTSQSESLPYSKELFEQLRQLRKIIAERDNVAPFIIFSDASLVEMAAKLPHDANEFLAINGVGQVKLHHYGAAFLQVIQAFARENTAPIT